MEIIGQRMKERRKELKISVDELAAKLGKDRSTIYRYEKGDIENLPIDILEPIAAALDTTPAYLMGWEDNSHRLPPTTLFSTIVDVADKSGKTVSELIGEEILPEDYEGHPNIRLYEVRKNAADRRGEHTAAKTDPEYYLNDETKQIAQEIYDSPELKSLFDMSRKMTPERLKAHIELMKQLMGGDNNE